VETLRNLLGKDWQVTCITFSGEDESSASDSMFDGRIDIRPPDTSRIAELLVKVREQLTPRQVNDQLAPIVRALRMGRAISQALVISPWLSRRTQETLREHGIDYLDLTGNASLAVSYPAIRIHTHGASQPPQPVRTAARNVTLSGPRAGRIVRFLTDFAPPYRANQIAEAADVSAPWVSRLLNQLEDQLLIERTGHNITKVMWPDLLRARAETYKLLRPGRYVSLIAPRGTKALLSDLGVVPFPTLGYPNIAVTGPYAARAVAPLAVGGQLMLYIDQGPHEVDGWADQLGLIRAEEGADVLLIHAPDKSIFERHRVVDGVAHVALSQLALDCLSGTGRMPAEGEAIVEMMAADETAWRQPSAWHQQAR
jgi:hypothetical protein